MEAILTCYPITVEDPHRSLLGHHHGAGVSFDGQRSRSMSARGQDFT